MKILFAFIAASLLAISPVAAQYSLKGVKPLDKGMIETRTREVKCMPFEVFGQMMKVGRFRAAAEIVSGIDKQGQPTESYDILVNDEGKHFIAHVKLLDRENGVFEACIIAVFQAYRILRTPGTPVPRDS